MSVARVLCEAVAWMWNVEKGGDGMEDPKVQVTGYDRGLRYDIYIPSVALGHGRGHQRTGDGVRTVGHGEGAGLYIGQYHLSHSVFCVREAYSRHAVGLTTVHNRGGLGAVSGVVSDDLGGVLGGSGASGQGDKGSDGETHCG